MALSDDAVIIEALRSGNDMAKERAALSVRQHPDLWTQGVIEILETLLQHRNWHVRGAAAVALIACLGEAARDKVQHLTQDRAYGVRQDVTTALAALSEHLRNMQQTPTRRTTRPHRRHPKKPHK